MLYSEGLLTKPGNHAFSDEDAVRGTKLHSSILHICMYFTGIILRL